jgi:hypothetical protein
MCGKLETGNMLELSGKTILKLENIFFILGTKDDTKKHRLRETISDYMTRAENIKKCLDQEKEGKGMF